MQNKNYHDVHTHILSAESLPEKVLERWDIPESIILQIANKLDDVDFIVDAAEWIYNLFAENDIDIQPIIDHYCRSIKENVMKLAYQANDAGIDSVTILLLDLAPNWGISHQLTQEEEHRAVFQAVEKAKKFCDIKVFMGVNLKKDSETIIKNFRQHPFSGIKIYSKLAGNKPTLEHRDLWEFCEAYRISITVHCSTDGIGTKKDNANPAHWFDILWKFPNLKVNFAHHGRGSSTWRSTIELLMQEFPWIYVDTSFDSAAVQRTSSYFNWLRDLLTKFPDRVIFGSDFPLPSMKYNYGKFVRAFRTHLGKYWFEVIAHYNPTLFLSRTTTLYNFF